MSTQTSFFFSQGTNATLTIVGGGASGGVIINSISARLYLTGAAPATLTMTLQDSTPATLLQCELFIPSASVLIDTLNIEGLNIPCTLSGGLAITLSFTGGGFGIGNVIYTVPI